MRVRGILGGAAGLVAVACFLVPGHALARVDGGPSATRTTAVHAGQQAPKEIFKTVCSNCHGPQGKGNGPAGMAFNPRPANFTDPAFWKTHTDAQIIQSITKGKGMMPPFGATYDAATIKGLVKYLHVLSGLDAGGSKSGS